jgi:excisionase family DNA binding protein
MSDPEIITIAEAAKLLRIGERTAYQLARDGQLAGAIKVGSQWRIDREVLVAWIKSEATRGLGAA